MRFLIPTTGFAELDFYLRLSVQLRRRGHEVVKLVVSRRAAEKFRRAGFRALYLPDLLAEVGPLDLGAEVARIEARYATPSLRDAFIHDTVGKKHPEGWWVERTVRQFKALERVFDEIEPDFMIPEIGQSAMTMAAHYITLDRGATGIWMLHSIFPQRMRIYANAYHEPVVPQEEVRKLSGSEREEIERFVAGFTRKAKPVLEYRLANLNLPKLRAFGDALIARMILERDHEYIWPLRYFLNPFKVHTRRALSKPLWRSLDPERPFFYFPIHHVDDFKIDRAIPHCADQEYLIRLVAQSLPQGYDLVVKGHPYSIGRNPVSMLRRLSRIPNVRLVDPFTSSHELMRAASAITVISSTVGIEALMYGKPVLTMGQPYYAGYGLTRDVDSFRELREAVPALLGFRPDRERVLEFLHAYLRSTYEGSPDWIDQSDENVASVADSLDRFARAERDAMAAA